jgi:PAS domain S-box-containing protein
VSQPDRSGRPTTRPAGAAGSRLLLGVGLLLALLLLAGVGLSVWRERQQTVNAAMDRAELLARVLEDHATRSIDTASLALAALGESLGSEAAQATPHIGLSLQQTLANLPVLREVAIVDRQGLVLATTTRGLEGRVVQLDRLGPLPSGDGDRLGPFIPGRDLGVLLNGTPSTLQAAPPGVGFVPLVRALQGAGRGLLLVGLINPDAIANHQQQILGQESASGLLLTFDGRVLSATAGLSVIPGSLQPELAAFRTYLPRVEHAQYVGEGAGGPQQVVAFRASRARPLVVQVEMPLDAVLAPWAADAAVVGSGATVVAAMLLLISAVAARMQQGRAQARAEVELREREMSVIVGSVQELIFRTDADGRLLFINARWESVSPVPLAQALNRPLADLVHDRSRSLVTDLFARVAGHSAAASAAQPVAGTLQATAGSPADATGARDALVWIGPADAPRQFELHLVALHEGGRVAGYAGSAVDVTERLAGQARLSEQLAFNKLLFEMLPLPVSMLDTQGRYVMVNQAWEAFTGLQRGHVLGQQARRFLQPDEAALHDEVDRSLLQGGGSKRYEASRLGPDGGRRDLSITKTVVPGPDGRPAGVLAAFMDVTEAREVERAVREARDAAEEASRSKSEFVANISHELRTPLQSIIGFSELGQLRGRDVPKLAGMFGDIHGAGQRMLALVNDLLDVSKIESTVGTFHLERTDLRPLVREVLRELEPLLGGRNLGVALDLGDMPLVSKVDPLRFQQVVRNVMANAIRFSPPGQAIEVTGELTAANEVHLQIRDRGPGIPPAELESIFEAFVQSSKTKDGSGGTGLGLAICRKIVEAHGGRICAAPAPRGEGSVFHITLPARGFTETMPGSL